MPAGLLGVALLAACAGAGAGSPVSRAKVAEPPDQPPGAAQPAEAAEAAEAAVDAPEPGVGPEYLPAGAHERTVTLDGQKRRWMTVVPPPADGVPAAGVVVVLHGVGARGVDMRPTAGLEPLAAPAGVVLVFPDAFGGAWNDGRPGADAVAVGTSIDDVRFLRLVIDETVTRTGAPPGRVAVVGFSAGAVMASRVGCELAERVAALALVGGSAGQGFEQTCRPAKPLATLLVAGSADSTVPYSGGRVADWGTRKRGFVASVDDVAAFWSAQGGCGPVSPQPAGVATATVSEARAADCRAGTAVVRYRVIGGGHEWFRAPRFDTTGAVWQFVNGRFTAAAGAAATAAATTALE